MSLRGCTSGALDRLRQTLIRRLNPYQVRILGGYKGDKGTRKAENTARLTGRPHSHDVAPQLSMVIPCA